jgi:hypothetical protein
MQKSAKVTISTFLLLFLGIFLAYVFYEGTPENYHYYQADREKVAVQSPVYNNTQNVVFIEAKSFQKDIILSQVIIKDFNGNVVVAVKMSDTILEGQSKTITVNIDKTLASGPHTATFVTKAGSSFVSPPFNVP